MADEGSGDRDFGFVFEVAWEVANKGKAAKASLDNFVLQWFYNDNHKIQNHRPHHSYILY